MKSGRAPAIGSTGPLPALSTVAAALLVVGCASAPGDGGARGAEPVSPVPDRVSDGDASSTATPEGSPSADVNRRILEAAARDPATATDGAPENHENYRIGPGDRLETNVFGVEEFSGTFLVGQGGEIAVPLLGPVPAAGRTPRQLEGLLEDRLRATYMKDPHVTVQVVEMQSHGVSVIGAVHSPGVYQIAGTTSLLQVLAMAEGLTDAAGDTVAVVRRGPGTSAGAPAPAGEGDVLPAQDQEGQVIEVDLASVLASGPAGGNVDIHPGDVVQVRPAGLVYVVGEVNRPGGYAIPAGAPMTVLQAVAMAQGLGRTAAADRSIIVRQGADGTREEVPVALDDVLEGSTAAPTLRAHDVLFVPNSRSKSFGLGIVNALVRMVTLRGLIY